MEIDGPMQGDHVPVGGNAAGGRKLLLHSCCGPCSAHCIDAVRRLGYEPTLFYANDNLAPRAEYERRLEALSVLARREGVPLVVPEYDHSAWLHAVAGLEQEVEGGARCGACFRHNLLRAAAYAAEAGFEEFASSLTVSPRKRSAMVFEAGRDAADAACRASQAGPRAPTFTELDFKKRGGFLRSVELARAYGLYRQDYCGCEFSRRSRDSEA